MKYEEIQKEAREYASRLCEKYELDVHSAEDNIYDKIVEAYLEGRISRQEEVTKLVQKLEWVLQKLGNHSVMEGYYDEVDKFLTENRYQ